MIAVLFVGLTLMSASVTAQVKDWKIIGRIQIQAVYDTTGGSELFIKRSRVWTNGYFLPKLSFRFQYDFNTNKLMDTWVSLWHIPNLEIRIGRTWLPFIGDFTESPFLLDMIDFSVGATLFPAREQGVFFLGHYKSLSYNLSVVNGSGFAKDENKWKDIFGYLKLSFLNGKLTLEVDNDFILGTQGVFKNKLEKSKWRSVQSNLQMEVAQINSNFIMLKIL